MGVQRAGRLLEALALDEAEERLAGDGAEQAVEVKRREGRQARQGRQRQVVGEMLPDMIDDPVDPLLVLEPAGIGHRSDPPDNRQLRLPGLIATLPAVQSGQASGG
jgi:hypothetical protein